MNEQKLKDLWWKARIGYNEQNCDPEVLAKFAELIVRECFEVVINDGRFNDCKGIIRGAEAVAKEHFGVEE